MKVGRRDLGALAAALILPRIARADDSDDQASRIERAQSQLKTLSGSFTQERTIGLLRSKVTSRGKLTLARPDRLRWELLPPDEIVYWVTPSGLAYKSPRGSASVASGPATGPAVGARIARALDDLHALLGDLAKLRHHYLLKGHPLSAGAQIEALPKDPGQSTFKKLTVELGPDLVRPLRVTLIEGPKDSTEIVFGELVVNGPVDPKLLEPPA
jgi:hypothetical protein